MNRPVSVRKRWLVGAAVVIVAGLLALGVTAWGERIFKHGGTATGHTATAADAASPATAAAESSGEGRTRVAAKPASPAVAAQEPLDTRLPGMASLERLTRAPGGGLQLTDAQRQKIEGLTTAAQSQAAETLSDLRTKEQNLRRRLADENLDVALRGGLQRELVALTATDAQRVAALDQQFRGQLSTILTAEQLQALNQVADVSAAGGREGGRPGSAKAP